MNPQIRKLAEQAGFYPALTWDHSDWHAAGHSSLFEKFAELLWQEAYQQGYATGCSDSVVD